MHSRLIVLTNEGTDSHEARIYVDETLITQGFVDEGRFTSPIADWFVIGGRFSGDLTKALLHQGQLEAFETAFEKRYGSWLGGENHVTEQDRFRQSSELFKMYFPYFKGLHPFWRDPYKPMGYEDDAMRVTDELWNSMLIALDKESVRSIYDGNTIVDLECDEIGRESSIHKWAVVVDFHF